jgi:peptide/nickel transport system substrate-binding protein
MGTGIVACGGDPTLKPYPYDPEGAKRLLKEAGYENLELNIANYKRGRCPEGVRMVEAIASMWNAIGIKTNIHMTEYAAWRTHRRANDRPGWVMWADIPNRSIAPAVLRGAYVQFHSKGSMTQVRDPEVDAIFDKANASLDPAEVEKLIGDLHRSVHKKYLVVPICEIGYELASTKNITDWEMGQRSYDKNFNDLIRRP